MLKTRLRFPLATALCSSRCSLQSASSVISAATAATTTSSCAAPSFSCSPVCVSTQRAWSAVPPVSEEARAFEEAELAREAAGVDSLIKCIEKERDDEALRLDKAAPKIPAGWSVEHTEGTSFFMMRRVWNDEVHTIRATLTTRDPTLDPECDLRGEHFPFNLTVERETDLAAARGPECTNKTLDFSLDVVEGECTVDKVRVYDSSWLANERTPRGHFERNTLFPGPNLDEAEEEVLDSVQLYLAERQIDDQLGEFIGQYSVWIEQLEYERWLKNLQNFVAA